MIWLDEHTAQRTVTSQHADRERQHVWLRAVPVQDVHCLLKGALLQGAVLGPVDAVASDGHEVPAPSHGVTQDSQVAVVYIGPIKLNHTTQLLQQRIPGSFNAENIDGLNDVIAGCPGVVYTRHTHHLHQGLLGALFRGKANRCMAMTPSI